MSIYRYKKKKRQIALYCNIYRITPGYNGNDGGHKMASHCQHTCIRWHGCIRGHGDSDMSRHDRRRSGLHGNSLLRSLCLMCRTGWGQLLWIKMASRKLKLRGLNGREHIFGYINLLRRRALYNKRCYRKTFKFWRLNI